MNVPRLPLRERTTRWPGFTWRVLAHSFTKPGPSGVGVEAIAMSHQDHEDWTCFDELVIGAGEGACGPLLHVEQMNDRDWWIGVGDCSFALDVWREPNGDIGVMVRDETDLGGRVKVQYDGGRAAREALGG